MVDERTVVEYNFIEVNGANGLKLESGEFDGVIVTLSDLSVQDDGTDNPDGSAVLSFNYDVVYDAEKPKELFETIDFKNTIGDILMKILTDSIKEAGENIESEYADFEEPSLL
jgi:hypothetical protein